MNLFSFIIIIINPKLMKWNEFILFYFCFITIIINPKLMVNI